MDTNEQQPQAAALRHLLLSFPELDVADNGRDVVDALVEGVVCQLITRQGINKVFILGDIATALRDLAGLSYEGPELVAAFERLERRGRLSFKDETHRSFVFSEQSYRQIQESFRNRSAEWDSVRTGWLDEVRHAYGLEDGQAQILWDALDRFVADLINSHGAEAAAFLYAVDGTGQSRFYEALSHRIPQIEEFVREDLIPVANAEFHRFFDPTNRGRVDYLVSRLRASFFFHLLSVDPSASELVREHVADKIFYLDSNFVFRLLGFHGPSSAFGAITAVEVSRQLKCRLVVAAETVDECVRVVRAIESQLRTAPIRREDYLRIAAEQPAYDGEFMATYYRELQSGRIKNAAEFILRWTNVRAHLKEWEIEVDEEAFLSEEESVEHSFLDEVSKLGQWHNGNKGPDALDHDIYILRMMRRMRGKLQSTPAETQVWFLTYDRQLARYSAYYAKEGQVPAVLMGDDWLQVARPFLPRTDDYAKSFVVMLANPLIFATAAVPFAHMTQALSRLERYAELPASVVSAMIADAQFIRAFASADQEEEARQLLEIKVQEIATSTATANDELKATLTATAHQVGVLQQNVDTLRDARDAAYSDAEKLRAQADAEKRASEAAIARLKEEHTRELQESIAKAASSAASEVGGAFSAQLRHLRNVSAAVIAGIIVTSILIIFGATKWPLTPMQVVLLVSWAVIVWSALLAITKGWNMFWTVLGGVLAIIAMVFLTHDVWTKPQDTLPVREQGIRPDSANTPAHSRDTASRPPAVR